MRAINWTTYASVTAAALVILSAGILGYTALYDLFVSIGLFSAWLGVFFPLLFDLAEIAAAVAVFNAKLQGEEDRFAWGMVIFFTVLGIIANIGHATAAWYTGRIDTVQVILAIFATSLFPLSVALVTHLVKRVIARDIARRGHLSSLAELSIALRHLVDRRDTLTADVSRLQGQAEQVNAQIEQARNELKAVHLQQRAPQIEEMNAARQAKIDERRTEVLTLLQRGMSQPAIADELRVSLATVKRDAAALNGVVREVSNG